MPTRYLSFREAGEQTGFDAAALRRAAIKHGKATRVGRSTKIHPDHLEELLDLTSVRLKIE